MISCPRRTEERGGKEKGKKRREGLRITISILWIRIGDGGSVYLT